MAPRDRGWVALVDGKRYAYIYFAPSDLDSVLSNRKTGQKVPTNETMMIMMMMTVVLKVNQLAKEAVVSLEGAEDILGAVAGGNDCLLLLTKTKLIAAILVQKTGVVPEDKAKAE